MSRGVAAGSQSGEPPAARGALSGVCLFLGLAAHEQRGPSHRSQSRGLPRPGAARSQTVEKDRAGGLAVSRYQSRMQKGETWPGMGLVALQTAPRYTVRRALVDASRARN